MCHYKVKSINVAFLIRLVKKVDILINLVLGLFDSQEYKLGLEVYLFNLNVLLFD